MSFFEYLSKAAATWFLGFFPYFEIYVAVPAGIIMGLDYVSAVVWSVFGNFVAVPLVIYFYDRLLRVESLRRVLRLRRRSERFERALDRYGHWVVLVVTPIVGAWVVAVMAQAAGMNRGRLMLYSFVSIVVYAVAIAVAISLGIAALTDGA